jgi:integrase/recombinase XerC
VQGHGTKESLVDVWSDAIELWVCALRAAGRRPKTIELREYQLRRIAAALAPASPWEVTGGMLVQWVGSQVWSPSTLRSFRAGARGFYRWAHGNELVKVDPALALPAVKPSQPNPRPAPEDAYRLARAKSNDRVRLMLRLAAELGLRRGEVSRMHRDDLGRDLFGWTLHVKGKGARFRSIPVMEGLAGVILRHVEHGYLFPGRIEGHLSEHYVGKLVAAALPEGWSMHSLRHRFATHAYSVDRDLLTVQELLGHASPVTTRLYVLLPAERLRMTMAAVAAIG